MLTFADGAANKTFTKASMKRACSTAGFNFIRFAGTAYWPVQMAATYMRDPDSYWATFDELVVDASEVGVATVTVSNGRATAPPQDCRLVVS